MTDASTAFFRSPSQERGILDALTYCPLTLHAADVDIQVYGSTATVQLSLEYVNQTGHFTQAIAAFPAPPPYQIQTTSLFYDGRVAHAARYEQTKILRVVAEESALGSTSILDTTTNPVATQEVPWTISPGAAVLMKAVYHLPVPLAAAAAGEEEESEHEAGDRHTVTIPAGLIPAVVQPSVVKREYVTMLDRRSNLRYLGPDGGLHLHVRAQLWSPMRGPTQVFCRRPRLRGGSSSAPEVSVRYEGDSVFEMEHRGALPQKSYDQVTYDIVSVVAPTAEPMRIFTAPPGDAAAGGSATESAPPPPYGAISLNIAPSLQSCPVNVEMIIVQDTHSSAAAQTAAGVVEAVLRRLPPSTYADVVVCRDSSGGGPTSLHPAGAARLPDIALTSVVAFMTEEGVQRPLAGTSPHLPSVLRDVLLGRGVSTASPPGYARAIVLLSDAGGISDIREAVATVRLAAAQRHSCSVTAVAVGRHANTAFFDVIASASGGVFLSIDTSGPASAAESEAAVQGLVARAVPTLTGLRLQWQVEGGDGDAALCLAADRDGSDVPMVPQGSQECVHGLIKSTPPPHQRRLDVTVTGRVGAEVVEYTASATIVTSPMSGAAADEDVGSAAPADDTSSSLLRQAAAAARIRYLTCSAQLATEEEAREAADLSQRFSLPCLYTSLVVEPQSSSSSPAPAGAPPQKRRVVSTPLMGPQALVEMSLRTRQVALQGPPV